MPKKCYYCKWKLSPDTEKVESPIDKKKMYICDWCYTDLKDEFGR